MCCNFRVFDEVLPFSYSQKLVLCNSIEEINEWLRSLSVAFNVIADFGSRLDDIQLGKGNDVQIR